MQKEVSLIIASTFEGGIGIDDKLPWYIPEELHKFKQITTNTNDKYRINAIIMGKKTWESLPRRPLQNRLNIIITSDLQYNTPYKDVIVLHSLHSAIMYCNNKSCIDKIFIIGGANVYNQFLSDDNLKPFVSKIYLSVMFYNPSYIINKYIDMRHIYEDYIIKKHDEYSKYSDSRLFASYICIPKNYNKT